jgi:hypothetical protein
MDWWMDILTTYIHHSERQVIIALLLITTLYKPLAHAKSSQLSLDVSWRRFLTVEILQLPTLRSSCHSRPCRTQLNSTIEPYLLSLPCRAQLKHLNWTGCPNSLLYNSSARTTPKTSLFYCFMLVSFLGNVLTEPLLRNSRFFTPLLRSNCCTRLFRDLCLATGLYTTILLIRGLLLAIILSDWYFLLLFLI